MKLRKGVQFGTAVADPPWPEKGGGKIKRGADRWYPTMSVRDIATLNVNGKHVSELFAPDAHLYLWVTNNFLPSGFNVMAEWGFRYVTCITWAKVTSTGAPQTGLGQYFRGATEHLLFGVRGHPPYKIVNGVRGQGQTLILAPRTKVHSEKPSVHSMVERVSHGPFIELFARKRVQGWAAWGHDAPQESR